MTTGRLAHACAHHTPRFVGPLIPATRHERRVSSLEYDTHRRSLRNRRQRPLGDDRWHIARRPRPPARVAPTPPLAGPLGAELRSIVALRGRAPRAPRAALGAYPRSIGCRR